MQPSSRLVRLGRVNGETTTPSAWPATEEFDDFIRARHAALCAITPGTLDVDVSPAQWEVHSLDCANSEASGFSSLIEVVG